MRALSEAEFTREAKPAFERIFVSENPFECAFASAIEVRMILFPAHYTMESSLAKAVIKEMARRKENAFYFSILERPKADEQDRPYHWEIPANQLEEYRSLGYPFVLENAIYATDGAWGIMFSHEHHALLGGAADFVQAVTKTLPQPGKQIEKFVEAWKHNHDRFGSDLEWLPRLLQHVCGNEQAQKLIANTGLEILPAKEAPLVQKTYPQA